MRWHDSRILGDLFQPPTLLGFALQSFHPSGRSRNPFGFPSPLLRFPAKPCDLAPALQRLVPTPKAVPLIAPRVFSSGRDRCSLELSDLSGSPSVDPRKRSSPSLPSPRVLSNPQPYDKKLNEPQGIADRQLGCSPHYRAPACLAFWTSIPPPPLEKDRRHRTIFSSQGPSEPCGPERASLRCLRPSA
jgi:hypothetical protein